MDLKFYRAKSFWIWNGNTMNFPTALIRGHLIKRYKRFFADVQLDSGEIVTAHCPNTGAMLSCAEVNSTVFLSKSTSEKRKLGYTLELSSGLGGLIGVNTLLPNRIVAEAIAGGKIAELAGYAHIKREASCGEGSRIDFLLSGGEHHLPCYVEVKSVTYFDGRYFAFPDAVTLRGAKHLRVLAEMVQSGSARAVIFFLVNRSEKAMMRVASEIDPRYAGEFTNARLQGVEALCYQSIVTTAGIAVGNAVEWM
jgi:sugar fermentation stimulation protein A